MRGKVQARYRVSSCGGRYLGLWRNTSSLDRRLYRLAFSLDRTRVWW